MLNQFSRTELLIGKEGMEKLKNARVAVFGIGGVGGYTVEALVRSGVGTLDLIDDDIKRTKAGYHHVGCVLPLFISKSNRLSL